VTTVGSNVRRAVRARRAARPCAAGDDGSAVAEFVLAGAFVVLLLLSVVQLALALHVRTVVVDAASEGARLGARAGMTLADARERAQRLLTENLSESYAQDVAATTVVRDGARLVEVRVAAPLPLVALLGPSGSLEVQAHALEEPR